MNGNLIFYNEIIDKLEKLKKREYSVLTLLGIQSAAVLLILTFTTFAVLEAISNFSSTVRTVLFIILILFAAASFFLFIIPLLKHYGIFRKTDYYKTASFVGSNYPEIKDDLVNAMQLVSSDTDNKIYSTGLIEAAFKNIYNKTKQHKFESIINFEKPKKLFYFTTGIILFCSLLLLAFPSLQGASYRLMNYQKDFTPPPKFSLEVLPGNIKITKGENVYFTVRVNGGIPGGVFLASKSDEKTDYESHKMEKDSLGNYNLELSSLRSSLKYYALADEIESPVFSVEVIDNPVIQTLDVIIRPPAYSKLGEIQQKDNGNITSLPGSLVSVRLRATKELKDSRLSFKDTSVVNLKTSSFSAEGSFRLKNDNQYKILITDINGNNNNSPITYTIKTLTDAYPSLEIISPGKNSDLSNDNRLALSAKAADDYGFTKLLLNYKLSESRYEPAHENFTPIEIPIGKDLKEADVNYIWNLSSLALGAEDVITYYLELFDNDNVNGPKSVKSEMYMVRVPSLDEILARADDTHEKVEDELSNTLKEADELKKTLEKIDQDLKKNNKEISWEEKQKIENALQKFEDLQDKVQNSAKDLQQMQNELQKNDLLSKETLEKYMELQKLFEELSSEEMKKISEQMRNMLENLNKKQTQQTLENFKINEEMFKKSIERTLNLLKRVKIEQKLDNLIKRTEEVSQEQQDLQKNMKENDLNNQNKNDQMSKKQDEISEELDKMKKEMEELEKEMSDLKDMPNEEMQKLMEEFEKQKNEQLSEEAKKNIKQKQMQSAQQNQSQLQQNMDKMKNLMEEMQNSMMQESQMQTFTDMMRILDNIINLSKQQEELKKESQKLDFNSTKFHENTKKQSSLQQSLDKILQQLSELSQKTFAVTPEMGKALGDAKREMNKSLQSLQSRNGNMASLNQNESMKSLNESASLMKGQMESMMQGGGQGGMMSMMQQLGQMSQQQMGINNLTQMLQKGMQGQLSPSEQAQMQRLSQQQQLIQKSLQQLNQEARQSGESKKLGSNLENILKEMQEVVTDMNTQRLDDKLIQKQERILSKLLDAQRSINERDFEKERESYTGENVTRTSPGELNLTSDKGKNKIKDELNKAVQEGYSKDYENLIRKYYESLQKEQK